MILPKSYNHLTVKQFIDADSIIRTEKKPLERAIKLIASLSGNPIDFIEQHSPEQIWSWNKELDFLNNPKLNDYIPKWLFIGTKVYKPLTDVSKLTAGQLIALKHYEEKSKGQEFLADQLACIFLPINWYGGAKDYDAKKHNEIKADMLKAKMGDVYGTLFFYSGVFEMLSPVMEIYLREAEATIADTMGEIMEWAKEQGYKVS